MTGLAPEVVAAQDSVSPAAGWTAWVGCWELLQDDVHATSQVEEIYQVSGGLPFSALELAGGSGAGPSGVFAALSPAALVTFQRLALLGVAFTTDELLALSDTDEDATYQHLEGAWRPHSRAR